MRNHGKINCPQCNKEIHLKIEDPPIAIEYWDKLNKKWTTKEV